MPPPAYRPLDETVYAIHKPRNVLSATTAAAGGDEEADDSGRPTLTDLMVAAGVAPLSAHVSRSDARLLRVRCREECREE